MKITVVDNGSIHIRALTRLCEEYSNNEGLANLGTSVIMRIEIKGIK